MAEINFPETITMKVEVRLSSRSCLHVGEISIHSQDEWPVVREKIRPFILLNEVAAKGRFNIDEPPSPDFLKIKQSSRATFKKYWTVDTGNFQAQLRNVWRNIQRNGTIAANWEWLLVVLGDKPERPPAMRTSDQMLRAASEAVRNVRPRIGPLEESFVVQQIARLPPSEQKIEEMVDNPNPNRAQTEMRYLDNLDSRRQGNYQQPRYFTIEVKINIDELKRAMGLPEHDIIRNYPAPIPPEAVSVNVSNPEQQDVDHQDL